MYPKWGKWVWFEQKEVKLLMNQKSEAYANTLFSVKLLRN